MPPYQITLLIYPFNIQTYPSCPTNSTRQCSPRKHDVRCQEARATSLTGHHSSHHVFRISPKHASSSYVIDLAGAQFGGSNTGFETSVYVRKDGNAIRSIAPLGIAKSHLGYAKVLA
jgi:hypothetical protein